MENNQYFSKNNNELPSNPKIIDAKVKDLTLKFKTDNGVFSKNEVDYGSRLLLETFIKNNKI